MDHAKSSNNGTGISPAARGIVTAAQAQTAIQGAVGKANSINNPFNIAIMDPFGHLVAFLRMDSAYLGSIDISMKKAKTVIMFNGAPSASFYEKAQPGGMLYGVETSNNGLVVFPGGLPLLLDGVLIGAIGVSGGTIEQDVMVAEAGAQAIGGVIPPSTAH